jgi:hypothetical protein
VTPRLAFSLATLMTAFVLAPARAQDCPSLSATPVSFSPEQVSRYQAGLRHADVRFLRQALDAHAAGKPGLDSGSSLKALQALPVRTAASRFAVLRVQAGMLGTRHIALVFQQEPGHLYLATTVHGHSLVEFKPAPLSDCQTRQLSAQLAPLLADPQLAI